MYSQEARSPQYCKDSVSQLMLNTTRQMPAQLLSWTAAEGNWWGHSGILRDCTEYIGVIAATRVSAVFTPGIPPPVAYLTPCPLNNTGSIGRMLPMLLV